MNQNDFIISLMQFYTRPRLKSKLHSNTSVMQTVIEIVLQMNKF